MAWRGGAGLCQQRLDQYGALLDRLGPFYFFYFGLICFSVMFYSFSIYGGLGKTDLVAVSALLYGALALGELFYLF
jgi:hypothetical protein